MTKLLLIIILKEPLNFLLLVIYLGVGFCGFTLVLLIVSKELSYDKFHKNYETIYRVVTETESGNVQIPKAYGALKEYLEGSVPSLQSVTHFIPVYYGMKVKSNDKYFVENSGVYVDESFNKVFYNTSDDAESLRKYDEEWGVDSVRLLRKRWVDEQELE